MNAHETSGFLYIHLLKSNGETALLVACLYDTVLLKGAGRIPCSAAPQNADANHGPAERWLHQVLTVLYRLHHG
jgi:hypothetical protein